MEHIIQFVIANWGLWLAFFVILGLLIYMELSGHVRGIPQVSPQELTVLMNRHDATVIDIRNADAFAKGHIIGAVPVNPSNLDQELTKLEAYKTKPVVICCVQGQESIATAVKLRKLGFDVKSLKGGIMAWQSAHLPLIKESK